MVISVSGYVTGKMREDLIKADKERAEALRKCYAIDGYKDLPLAEKNRIYDKIKRGA